MSELCGFCADAPDELVMRNDPAIVHIATIRKAYYWFGGTKVPPVTRDPVALSVSRIACGVLLVRSCIG